MTYRVLCLILLCTASAQAAVYRCDARDSGRVTYRNEPCASRHLQQELRVATPQPPELFAVPPVKEIPADVPVRVVPLIRDGLGSSGASSRAESP